VGQRCKRWRQRAAGRVTPAQKPHSVSGVMQHALPALTRARALTCGMLLAFRPAMRSLGSAAFALATLFFYGCASLPPATVAIDDQYKAGATPVRELVLLPPTVSVAVLGDHGPAPAYLTTEITRRTSALLVDAARTTLAHRGYRVAAELGWDGTAVLADG